MQALLTAPLFDAIYTGTETRDANMGQRLQSYQSYLQTQYFNNIKPGGNQGGWIDGGTDVERYAEQFWDTFFAKVPGDHAVQFAADHGRAGRARRTGRRGRGMRTPRWRSYGTDRAGRWDDGESEQRGADRGVFGGVAGRFSGEAGQADGGGDVQAVQFDGGGVFADVSGDGGGADDLVPGFRRKRGRCF